MKKQKNLLAKTIIAGTLALQSPPLASQHYSRTIPISQDVIRPFKVNFANEDLVDLKRRIAATRWPDRETVADNSQGIRLNHIQSLLKYWGTNYNWRKAEAKLNAFPQFITTIDSVDIHFIHVRSKEEGALPLIITHGWPGSVFELLNIIAPLTDPVSHNGKPEDAFDVVIPSLPGYGFSGRPIGTGWGPERIAYAWDILMKRLGYTHYVAQGGDWGAVVSLVMGRQAPSGLQGIHLNLVPALTNDLAQAIATGASAPSGLTDDERSMFEILSLSVKKGFSAYNSMMTARPQALGYGITDSPAGLAAWLLVHPGFARWDFTQNKNAVPAIDEVLDNITLYWLTNTAVSSARLYWENAGRSALVASLWKTGEINIPVAVSIFSEDAYRPPRSWVQNAYPTLGYFREVSGGGHFASWEQPMLFIEELRSAFKQMRL